MSVLSKKMLRSIRGALGQFLAVVAVVMVGIAIYISMTTASFNMTRSKDMFYQENNFADYYFHIIKAPESVTKQIEAIAGVTKATGRIQKDLTIIKEDGQRATARLTSYPLPMDTEVNRLHLMTGQLFEKHPQSGGIEILLDPQYAAKNRLSPGDSITVIAEGKQKPLTVTGTAVSPEFIFAMKDAASLVPEPETFGIAMIPQNQAQQILNLSGQINQVVVKLAPGVDEKVIEKKVKEILEPYGNLASYPRKQQFSDAILRQELEQLKIMAIFLPTIFLGIAALIQFIVIGRMIKTQRLQIGVMKALGYSNLDIVLYYSSYSLAISALGALLGSLLGLLFASFFSQMYAMFFNLPQAIGGINFKAILYGFSLSLVVGAVSGATASRGVARISPAESMRSEPPRGSGKILLESWPWLWRSLDATWKMSLRTISRNKMRSAVTLLGVIFAAGMLVVALFANDSVDYMINQYYYKEQLHNYLIRFNTPVKEAELVNISRLDGVIKAEPILELPVRINFEGRSREDLLLGLPPGVSLKKMFDPAGCPIQLPDEGLLLSAATAKKIKAHVGDRVEVETLLGLGPSRRASLKITGINQQLIGGSSCISLLEANRVIQESQIVSGVMLKVDPGLSGPLEDKLSEMTGVASILSRQKELDSFNKNMEFMIYSIAIMIAFAVVLGFAIIYNSTIMSFTERKRELASLRVIGFNAGEVSSLLLKENLLQSLIGIAVGLPFGHFLCQAYAEAVSSDLYTFQVVIYPLTYAISALLGVLFIMAAYRMAVKGVKRLDLVEVLKTRD